jgi:hypothetical protein
VALLAPRFERPAFIRRTVEGRGRSVTAMANIANLLSTPW